MVDIQYNITIMGGREVSRPYWVCFAKLSAIGIIITTLVFIVVCIIFTILAATSTKK